MSKFKLHFQAALLCGILIFCIGFWVVKSGKYMSLVSMSTFFLHYDGWLHFLLGSVAGFLGVMIYKSLKSS